MEVSRHSPINGPWSAGLMLCDVLVEEDYIDSRLDKMYLLKTKNLFVECLSVSKYVRVFVWFI